MDVVYVIVITSLICHIIIESFSVIDFKSKLIFLYEARVALSWIYSVYFPFLLQIARQIVIQFHSVSLHMNNSKQFLDYRYFI